jgi:hypothetical protein
MDFPFLLPQSRIFGVFGLTQDLKMGYGSDTHIVSVKLKNGDTLNLTNLGGKWR